MSERKTKATIADFKIGQQVQLTRIFQQELNLKKPNDKQWHDTLDILYQHEIVFTVRGFTNGDPTDPQVMLQYSHPLNGERYFTYIPPHYICSIVLPHRWNVG